MSAKETGGQAFPCKDIIVRGERGEYTGVEVATAGLTMRDYFAAHAMNTVCDELGRFNQYEEVAKGAYKMADAMLKARND